MTLGADWSSWDITTDGGYAMKASLCLKIIVLVSLGPAGCEKPVPVANDAPSVEFDVTRGHSSTWSQPVNLGPPINVPSADQSPALSPDGLSLYFASDRPGGQGGGYHAALRTIAPGKRPSTSGEASTARALRADPTFHPTGTCSSSRAAGRADKGATTSMSPIVPTRTTTPGDPPSIWGPTSTRRPPRSRHGTHGTTPTDPLSILPEDQVTCLRTSIRPPWIGTATPAGPPRSWPSSARQTSLRAG